MLKSGRESLSGVSPVIGVVLLVALTVIMAALVMATTTGFLSNEKPGNLAGLSATENADGTVTLQLRSSNVDSVIIVTRGPPAESEEHRLTNVGDSTTVPYGLDGTITVMGEIDGERTVIQHHRTDREFDSRVYITSRSGDAINDDRYAGTATYISHDDYNYPIARGIAMLELTPEGEFVSYGNYDTHGGARYRYADSLDANGNPDIEYYYDCDTDYCNPTFIDHLESIEDGNYVFFTVKDQANNINSDVYDHLRNDYGSTLDETTTTLDYRGTWIMAAVKGDNEPIFERTELRGRTSGIFDIKYTYYFR